MPAQLNSNYEFPTTNARIFHYPRPLTNTELFRMGRGVAATSRRIFRQTIVKIYGPKIIGFILTLMLFYLLISQAVLAIKHKLSSSY